MKTKIPPTVFSIVLLIATTFGFTAGVFAQDENYLGVADFLDFEQVNDAQISPNGLQIIYTRRWVDQISDIWASALWIMDADGSRHRYLIEGSNARWSTQWRSHPVYRRGRQRQTTDFRPLDER